MKTSVIEVRGMLSALSAHGVEKRIGEVPGVESVTVNYAAGSATVRCQRRQTGVNRAGHYALGPHNLSAYPPADLAIERLGDLLNYDFPALFRPVGAVDGEQETT